MSGVIDTRIVEMLFDNTQFEAGVKQSMSTLNNLKENLDMEESESGLQKVTSVIAQFPAGFKAATNSVGELISQIPILDRAISLVKNNLAGTAVNLGKELSIGQISGGFTKYENEISAVQTIMAATGKSIDEVTSSLEKLNWFTDETSYDYVDMVGNIGKFTSAGVELDDAITSMEGIANWAALAGQNTTAASRAMYNMSQAMATGSVQLRDWYSIENANMGTKQFKELAIETAKEVGTLNADGTTLDGKETVTYTNFRDTLQKDWFTSDVLVATLKKYGEYAEEVYKIASEEGLTAAEVMEQLDIEGMELGKTAFEAAQKAKTFTDAINATKDAVSTGWMKTFRLIIGDYEEASEFWTNVSQELWEIFASGAEKRNEILTEWRELGGREKLIAALSDAYRNLKEVVDATFGSIKKCFGSIDASDLMAAVEWIQGAVQSIHDFLWSGNEYDDNFPIISQISDIATGIGSTLKIAWNGIKAVFGGLGGLASGAESPIKWLLAKAAQLARKITAFSVKLENENFFEELQKKIQAKVDSFTTWFKDIWNKITNFKLSDLVEWFNGLKEDAANLNIGPVLTALFGGLGGVGIGKLVSFISKLKQTKDSVEEGKGLFETIGVWLKKYSKYIKIAAVVAMIASLADSINKVADAVNKLGSLSFGQLIQGLFGIVAVFGLLLAGLLAIQKIMPKFKDLGKLSGIVGVMSMLAGVLNLAVAPLTTLSTISWETLGKAAAILVGLGTIVLTLKWLMGLTGKDGSNIFKGKIAGVVGAMAALALILNLVTIPLMFLDVISDKAIYKGLGILAGLGAIVLVLKWLMGLTGKDGSNIFKGKIAGVVAAMAALALILSLSVVPLMLFNFVSLESIGKGLVALAGLGAIVLALKWLTSLSIFNKGKIAGVVGAMAALALILNLSVVPLMLFNFVSLESIGKGLVALAGLGAIVLALKWLTSLSIFNKGKIAGVVAAMAALALIMAVFAVAIVAIQNVSWENLFKAHAAIAGLGVIALLLGKLASLKVFNSSTIKVVKVLAIMAALALILNLMVVPLTIIDGISWEGLAKTGTVILGLGVLAVLTAVLGNIGVGPVVKGALALVIIAGAIGLAISILGSAIGETLKNCSKDIWQMAVLFSDMSTLLSGADYDNMSAMGDVIETLCGKFSGLTSNHAKVDAFTSDLFYIGSALSLFAWSLKGTEGGDVSAASKKAVSAMEDMRTIAGIAAELTDGGFDADALALALVKLGSAYKLYYASLVDADEYKEAAENGATTEDVSTSVAAEKMKETLTTLSSIMPDKSERDEVASYGEGKGNDLTDFALGIAAIGTALSTYATDIGGLNPFKIALANHVLNTFSQFQNGLQTQAAIQAITGFWTMTGEARETAVSKFTQNLTGIGDALSKFVDSVKDIKKGKIDIAVACLTGLVDLEDKLQKLSVGEGTCVNAITFRIFDWLGGIKDLGDLAAEMKILGSGFSEFITGIDGLSSEQIDLALGALTTLVDLEGKLGTEQHSIWGFLTGAKNLDTFGEDMGKLGTGLANLQKNADGVTIDRITELLNVTSGFATMEATLLSDGTLALTATAGSLSYVATAYSDLKTVLDDFATSISTFNSVDPEKMLAIGTLTQTLVDAQEQLSKIKNDEDYGNLATLYTQFSNLTKAIGEIEYHATDMEVLNFTQISAGIESLANATSVAKSLKTADATHLLDILEIFSGKDFGALSRATGKVMANNIFSEFGTSFQSGIDSTTGLIETLFESMGKQASTSVLTAKSSMYSSGWQFASGFARGIRLGTIFLVKKAATNMGTTAVEAANAATEIESPSKLMIESGKYLAEGLKIGINKSTGAVYDSGWVLGRASVDGFKDSIGMHSPPKEYEDIGATSGETAAGSLLDTAKDMYEAGKTVGAAGSEGFADGVSENADSLVTQMQDAAANAPKALQTLVDDGLKQITDTATGYDESAKTFTKTISGAAKSTIPNYLPYFPAKAFVDDVALAKEAETHIMDASVDSLKAAQRLKNFAAQKAYGEGNQVFRDWIAANGLQDEMFKRYLGVWEDVDYDAQFKDELDKFTEEQNNQKKSSTTRNHTKVISSVDISKAQSIFTAINAIGDKVTMLGDAVSSMQIVMDSGVMVGQIEHKVDQRLGQIAALKGRGL